jgi:hypothetical protein
VAEDSYSPQSVADNPAVAHCEKLRTLAGWYREFAERAGNPDIWALRLRTAEDLEAEADRVETTAYDTTRPLSPEDLRAEVRRLIDEVKHSLDDGAKRRLATKAVALSQRAEALAAVWREEPAIIKLNVERYRTMLKDGIDNAPQRQLIEQMLADAEAALKLHHLTAK